MEKFDLVVHYGSGRRDLGLNLLVLLYDLVENFPYIFYQTKGLISAKSVLFGK